VLDELEDNESIGKGSLNEETFQLKAQKNAKQLLLHQHYVTPLSFFIDAAN